MAPLKLAVTFWPTKTRNLPQIDADLEDYKSGEFINPKIRKTLTTQKMRQIPSASSVPLCFKGFGLLFLAALVALSGCSKSQPASEQPTAAPKAATISIDPATAGTISGVVSLKGQPPKMKPLDMTADPGCPTGPQPAEVVVANAGKLANVFVYVKEGLPQGNFAVPNEPVVLDQKGCRYNPHMLGIMAGQPLKITNTDTADHNIHDMPSNNPAFNESQMPTDRPVIKKVGNPEMMIPVQCNQHPWMRAYINVMSNPYFGVSAPDGSFEIKNLPPGEYTIAAVHERFGEQTMKVKVAPKESAKAAFVYSAQ